MGLELTQKTKDNIALQVGLPVNQIARLSSDDWDKHFEKKKNLKLEFRMPIDDSRLEPRGSVLLHLNRIEDLSGLNRKMIFSLIKERLRQLLYIFKF